MSAATVKIDRSGVPPWALRRVQTWGIGIAFTFIIFTNSQLFIMISPILSNKMANPTVMARDTLVVTLSISLPWTVVDGGTGGEKVWSGGDWFENLVGSAKTHTSWNWNFWRRTLILIWVYTQKHHLFLCMTICETCRPFKIWIKFQCWN